MPKGAVSVELNAKQLASFRKRVERWRGAPLHIRASMGTMKAADYMVPLMKKMAPRSSGARYGAQTISHGKPGTLRRAIRARKGKRGIISNAFVGPSPKARHRFLVTRGTDRHELGGSVFGGTDYRKRGDFVTGTKQGRGDYVVYRKGGKLKVRFASTITHPGAKADPFVDRATQQHHAGAFRIVNQILFGE